MNVIKNRYDPEVYGPVKAEFLNRLTGPSLQEDYREAEERRRQELIQQIREGELRLGK